MSHSAENDAPRPIPLPDLVRAYAAGEWCGECRPNEDGCSHRTGPSRMNETIQEFAQRTAREAREADALGVCYITVDGWCATHSTADGPTCCVIPPEETRHVAR